VGWWKCWIRGGGKLLDVRVAWPYIGNSGEKSLAKTCDFDVGWRKSFTSKELPGSYR
jgi:hypothetical protein